MLQGYHQSQHQIFQHLTSCHALVPYWCVHSMPKAASLHFVDFLWNWLLGAWDLKHYPESAKNTWKHWRGNACLVQHERHAITCEHCPQDSGAWEIFIGKREATRIDWNNETSFPFALGGHNGERFAGDCNVVCFGDDWVWLKEVLGCNWLFSWRTTGISGQHLEQV